MSQARLVPGSTKVRAGSPGADQTTGSDVAKASPDLPRTSIAESPLQTTVSVAIMAGIAVLPIMIAAGILVESREASSPSSEVSTASLRGSIDAELNATVVDDLAGDRSRQSFSFRTHAGS